MFGSINVNNDDELTLEEAASLMSEIALSGNNVGSRREVGRDFSVHRRTHGGNATQLRDASNVVLPSESESDEEVDNAVMVAVPTPDFELVGGIRFYRVPPMSAVKFHSKPPFSSACGVDEAYKARGVIRQQPKQKGGFSFISQPPAMPTFKICVLGDGGVGKSTLLRRLGLKNWGQDSGKVGHFEPRYVATLGVEVTPLQLRTSAGPICFNIWDTAGQEKFGGLRDGYYIQGQAGIIMSDATNPVSLKTAAMWRRDLVRVCGNLPIVYMLNKVEVNENNISDCEQFIKTSLFKNQEELQPHEVVECSVKNGWNLELAFLLLARRLLKDDSVTLLEPSE